MARVEGSETLDLPRDEVWRRLNDPDILGSSIPGCHGFERDGEAEHRYLTSISVAIGAVKGVYDGTVSYADIDQPERCTIKVVGKGDKGTIDGSGAIELKADGERTEVAYRGDFKLTGPVAGIGQRLAPGVSRKMIIETLKNLESHGSAEEPAAAGPDGTEAGPAGPVAASPGAAPEPFNPVTVPGWVRFAGPLAIGLVIGFLIGMLIG